MVGDTEVISKNACSVEGGEEGEFCKGNGLWTFWKLEHGTSLGGLNNR